MNKTYIMLTRNNYVEFTIYEPNDDVTEIINEYLGFSSTHRFGEIESQISFYNYMECDFEIICKFQSDLNELGYTQYQ